MHHTGERVVQVHRWDLKAVPVLVTFTSDGQLPEWGDVIQQGPSCFGTVTKTDKSQFGVLTTTPDFTYRGQLTIFGNFKTVLSYTTRTCDYSYMNNFWPEVKGVEVGPPARPPVGGPRVVHEEGSVHEEWWVVHESPEDSLLSIPVQTDPFDLSLQSGQMQLPWLEVKDSGITGEDRKPIGKGLFARQTFVPFMLLTWYDGLIARFHETKKKLFSFPGYRTCGAYALKVEDRIRVRNNTEKNTAQVYIDASTRLKSAMPNKHDLNRFLFLGAHYVNTNHETNAGAHGYFLAVGKEEISNGDEIFWDYNNYLFADDGNTKDISIDDAKDKVRCNLKAEKEELRDMFDFNKVMADFVKSGRAAPVENTWAPHTFFWKTNTQPDDESSNEEEHEEQSEKQLMQILMNGDIDVDDVLDYNNIPTSGDGEGGDYDYPDNLHDVILKKVTTR